MLLLRRNLKQLACIRTSLRSAAFPSELTAATTTISTETSPPSTVVVGPTHFLSPPPQKKTLLGSCRNSCSSSSHRFLFNSIAPRFSSTKRSVFDEGRGGETSSDEWEDEEEDEDEDGIQTRVEWEEEYGGNVEAQIGDGGDGGGVVLRDVPWGQRALSIAYEVLDLHAGNDIRLFSFKTSPHGYIYMRLDKLSNEYGCPSMEEIENFSSLYKKRLDEVGESGEIPQDLALEVSSPGAERILKVPDDLDRFKDMPMQVRYLEESITTESDNNKSNQQQEQLKEGIFLLDSIETESGHCVWKLADVRENRDASAKGRPLSRKQKDWRLRLPFEILKRVTLYLQF